MFDNDRYEVWAYFSDQKASLELKTGGKISLSLVHFEKNMSNCEREKIKNINIFAFNSVLLSFLGFGKLSAHILYTEHWCANSQVHIKWCMSENTQKIDFYGPQV